MGAVKIDFTKHVFIDGLNYSMIEGFDYDESGFGLVKFKNGVTQPYSAKAMLEIRENFLRLQSEGKIDRPNKPDFDIEFFWLQNNEIKDLEFLKETSLIAKKSLEVLDQIKLKMLEAEDTKFDVKFTNTLDLVNYFKRGKIYRSQNRSQYKHK